MKKKISFVIILLIISSFATVYSQEVTLDYKWMNIGNVRAWIPNNGGFWNMNIYDNPSLINVEYPIGSLIEHVGEGGLWVGAITPDNDTLVTVTSSWNPWGQGEFMPPTSEPWDTIWVVNKNDTVDIPYWENYVGKADRDFVFRYNDYNDYSMRDSKHNPLYLDVVEIVHNWSAPDVLANIKLYEYFITPTQFDLTQVYLSEWVDPNVGTRDVDFAGMLSDDYSEYDKELHMGMGLDKPGSVDGDCNYPVGFKIFPPDNVSPSSLFWTFKWGDSSNPPGITPNSDRKKYEQLMAARTIMEDQQSATGAHFIISFGPMSVAKGDTLHFYVAMILGEGKESLIETAKALVKIKQNDFNVPGPPPNPSIVSDTDDGEVTISWYPTEENNPELYFDKNRADGDTLPFEGYRIYKSTNSINGPWKLLAEYDIIDGKAEDIGLEYEYNDYGLLNNVEYYYSVTAFSKEDKSLNWPALETSIGDNAVLVVPGTAPPEKVGKVAVVPNPYRGDVDYNSYSPPWEKPPASRSFWMEQDRRIQFINLPLKCEIKIYTASGRLVETIRHNTEGTSIGYHDWNLTSSVGQAVSSGIYLFTVEDKVNNDTQIGKFVIIK